MDDCLITGTVFDDTVEIIAADTTNISKVSNKFHKLSKCSNIMLSRIMTASLLMSAFMKNDNESLMMSVDGNGKFGKIISIVNSKLDVRGCIENANVETCEDFKLGDSGYIKIIKDFLILI